MSSGLVTFRLGSREYAADLASVREVVRLTGLADLPGMTPPLAGVVDLRGSALPIMDLRTGERAARGDVLVLERPGGPVGVAVDQVRAVVDELPSTGAESGVVGGSGGQDSVLPSYVLEVLRGPLGPVFLVDLAVMLAAVGAGDARAVTG